MGACIVSKKIAGNRKEKSNQGGNDFPEIAWILPFMMLGAMFGSLAGAGLSLGFGYQMPFGPAVIGAIFGLLSVGVIGWLLLKVAKPG